MHTKDVHLEVGRQYHALSIKDLLEARDAYHVFLTRKKNVIGTAIGKYRRLKPGISKKSPKTLGTTQLESYSWPCLMVFVKEWIRETAFGKPHGASNEDYLPRAVYLPDGREIPVCVIQAEWGPKGKDTITRMKFPGSLIGGGYPVLTKPQNEERWATFGCLVSDGRLNYALSNAHVTGRPGETLFTLINGNEEEIGVSSRKQLQKKPFSEVYENLPGKHSLVNLDIGLVELKDLHSVSSQIYGLGKINGMADVNHDTLSLKLIGCPVMGYGCVSGIMKGEIIGLFYRYSTAGGYDYVADYLIGPRYDKESKTVFPFSPQKGDSGTLLVIDNSNNKDEHMKAIGMLWGGTKDLSSGKEQPYGLATNLGTICRQLDVELVYDWNTGFDPYFGAYAHILLPSLCASVVKDKTLRKLMENNVNRYSMPLGTPIKDTKGLSKVDFVPLSDVPDLVWKMRTGDCKRGKEGPNHFADMDQPNPKNNGQTLLDLCEDPQNVEPDVWVKFYEELGAKEKGALPFRIAQIYDAMVDAANHGKITEFVCSAGILTHYVFDACLPMHISYMHHGDPNGLMKTVTSRGKDKEVPLAYNVHAEFDNQMVEYYRDAISTNLPKLVGEKALNDEPVKGNSIKSTKDAAVSAVALMRRAVRYANPKVIVKDFEELVDESKRARCNRLWQKYGHGLEQAMAEAVVLTARLWEAAWKNGNGAQHIKSTDAIPENKLSKLYETKGFLESVNLEDIRGTMTWGND